MTPTPVTDLTPRTLDVGRGTARLDLPVGWTVEAGPPTVAVPPTWRGVPPAAVVSVELDDLRREALATAVAAAAMTRLTDPVIVSLGPADAASTAGEADGARRDDVEVVVAHRHRGVDVTTVERHHCRPGPARWVVGLTVAHPDVPRLLPLAHRIVASLVVDG